MKIAILGTRGIPNNYGGFEQLAEYLSLGLFEKGHEVYVYSSHTHPFKQKTWRGIHILHKFDPEKKIGTIGQFIYDLLCILDSRKRAFDAILNLGYTSSSIWMRFFPRNTRLITNMDGLEWKRSKYSKPVQRFLKYAEKLAVKRSHLLVADSLGISAYLKNKYNADSTYVAYGASLFSAPNSIVLQKFNTQPFAYNMLIARMEPENNLEMILDGVCASDSPRSFFVVGNYGNTFGTYLLNKYKHETRIVFTGSIYESDIINNLRYYSNIYFHGHSVGGTNPSLLEAMGCECLVAAHNNEFNRFVLGSDAHYFSNVAEVALIMQNSNKAQENSTIMVQNNCEKVTTCYSWQKITQEYEKVLLTNV